MSRVLLVEDDPWQAEQIVKQLEAAGHTAAHADDALAAIDALEAQLPDLIVLDMFLPGPSGVTLLHELQSHSDSAALPIIAYSAHLTYRTEQLAPYGVVAVLDKTIMTPGELVSLVEEYAP